MAERPDLIVLGGDYVTVERSPLRRAGGRGAGAAHRAARRLRASSAITTTIATCRRRWQRAASRCCGRAHAARRPRRAARSDRHPLLDAHASATSRSCCAAPRRTSILLAHTPTRLTEAAALAIPLMLSGHTHGGQIVLPGLGAVAARNFPDHRRARPAREHDRLRQPRRRHRLPAGPAQLPARSRRPDAQAALPLA